MNKNEGMRVCEDTREILDRLEDLRESETLLRVWSKSGSGEGVTRKVFSSKILAVETFQSCFFIRGPVEENISIQDGEILYFQTSKSKILFKAVFLSQNPHQLVVELPSSIMLVENRSEERINLDFEQSLETKFSDSNKLSYLSKKNFDARIVNFSPKGLCLICAEELGNELKEGANLFFKSIEDLNFVTPIKGNIKYIKEEIVAPDSEMKLSRIGIQVARGRSLPFKNLQEMVNEG